MVIELHWCSVDVHIGGGGGLRSARPSVAQVFQNDRGCSKRHAWIVLGPAWAPLSSSRSLRTCREDGEQANLGELPSETRTGER